MAVRRGFVGGRSIPMVAAAVALAVPGTVGAVPVVFHYGEEVFETGDIPPAAFDIATQTLVDGGVVPADRFGEAREQLFQAEYGGMRMGWACDALGIFWAYVHQWNCRPILFRQDDGGSYGYFPLDMTEYEKQMQPQYADREDFRERDLAAHRALIGAIEREIGGPFVEVQPPSSARVGFWARHGRWFLGGGLVLLVAAMVIRRRRGRPSRPSPAPPPVGDVPPG